jgi:hypothetical protein
MPSPSQHPKTGVYQFRQRVPASIGSLAAGEKVSITIDGKLSQLKIGKELKVSLGTKDPRRAKELAKEAQDQFDLIWASFANAPVRLSLRQCVALSGEVYRVLKSALEDEPGPAGQWATRRREAEERESQFKGGPLDALKIGRPRSLSERWGTWVDGTLADHHLRVDAKSYERLLAEFDRAFGDVAELLERRARGDFGPDQTEQRFPAFEITNHDAGACAASRGHP